MLPAGFRVGPASAFQPGEAYRATHGDGHVDRLGAVHGTRALAAGGPYPASATTALLLLHHRPGDVRLFHDAAATHDGFSGTFTFREAGNREKMPPKSTYFYPKLVSGLVFSKVNPGERLSVPQEVP